MTMNEEFARRVMRRLNGEPDDYTLPAMPHDKIIDYLDSLRLPEQLEQLAQNKNVTHEQRANIQDMLDLIHAGFTAGELSLDEYTRLTTTQNRRFPRIFIRK